MNLININLNQLRVFEYVCRFNSMTKAANALHLTQSGVSQSIKALEELLGQKLFDRYKGRLLLTPEASRLYKLLHGQLRELEEELAQMAGDDLKLQGEISLGVPIEYGNRFVLPFCAEFMREHPLVSLNFTYGHAAQMSELLLRGELDFAIVDSYGFSPQLDVEDLDYETHTLCAHRDYLDRLSLNESEEGEGPHFFKKLSYIAYLPGHPVLSRWFKFHLARSGGRNREMNDINIVATLMDVQGVAQLIRNGVGVGVLPLHVVERLQERAEKIIIFKGNGREYRNSLSIVSLKGRSTSYTVKYLKEALSEYLGHRRNNTGDI